MSSYSNGIHQYRTVTLLKESVTHRTKSKLPIRYGAFMKTLSTGWRSKVGITFSVFGLAAITGCNEFKFDQIDFVTHPKDELRVHQALTKQIKWERDKRRSFGDLMRFKKDNRSYYASFFTEKVYRRGASSWAGNTGGWVLDKCQVAYKEVKKIFNKDRADIKEIECKKWKQLAKIVETGAGYTHSSGWEPVDAIDINELKTALTASNWGWQSSINLPTETHVYHWKYATDGNRVWKELDHIDKSKSQVRVKWDRTVNFFNPKKMVRPEQISWSNKLTSNFHYPDRYEPKFLKLTEEASFIIIGKQTEPGGRRRFMLRTILSDEVPQLKDRTIVRRMSTHFNSDIRNARTAADLFDLTPNGTCLNTRGQGARRGPNKTCWYRGADEYGYYSFAKSIPYFRYLIVEEPLPNEKFIDLYFLHEKRFSNNKQEKTHLRLDRK